jgi:two-component system CheB/CheR fusion protein
MNSKAKKKTPTLPTSSATPNFPVIGVGASAGGLEAFKQLIREIPSDSGMAYVLVQHLNPSHESNLTEILSRGTKIPVQEITDELHIEPNHIYVIPPDKILTTADGRLNLSPRDSIKTNLVIDVFFTSLAVVREGMAVGVVLSGTGSDGTLGLKMIKEHGGITFAEDSTAAYNDMPQSAINAGVVDFVLPANKIPAQLLQIKLSFTTAHAVQDEESISKDVHIIFKQMLSLLQHRRGVDFVYYKQSTVRRRIARRMALHRIEQLSDYLDLLRNDRNEQDTLFQDLLIPVTSFFRDPKTFETLSENIFPAIFKNKSTDEPARFWIAGCSTGEEVYSIAICLHEFLGNTFSGRRIQIFASDISGIAVKKARLGMYNKNEVQSLPPDRLKKYFTKVDGNYQVHKIIRDICIFAEHNFLKDPPFAKVDLISCRNVMIYMDPFLQKKALTNFHYALNPNGFLLLGKSETASAASELFTLLNKHDKIYSRKPIPSRYIHVASERVEKDLALQNSELKTQDTTQTDFRKSAESILLTKYTPASVVVNEHMDIVHIHGSITPYLEPSPGKPTFNLLKMAREGLGFELRNALHKAKIGKTSVSKEGIPTRTNGKQSLVRIEIIPLTDSIDEHYLIVFEKSELPSVSLPKSKVKHKDESNVLIQQLKNELAQTREDMRSISEEQEAVNEELQSSNEELQSSNEEMQSLNEELETSKEELQSTNEELTILNHELIDKQDLLNEARLYSEAIVATIREPLIVLDKNLRIRTANASFCRTFYLAEQEVIGKLFYEIGHHQWEDKKLRGLLEKVLPFNTRIENFEILITFPTIGERTMLFNALQMTNEKKGDEKEKLILLAIEDITQQKNADEKEAIFATIREPLIILDKTLRVKNANPSFYKKFKTKKEEITGKKIYEIVNRMFDNTLLSPLLEKVLPQRTQITDYEIIVDLPPFGTSNMLINARQINNEKTSEQLILLAIEDITERKIAEQRTAHIIKNIDKK